MCRNSLKSLVLTELSTTIKYCRVFLHSGGACISGAFMTYFLTNLTAIKINFKFRNCRIIRVFLESSEYGAFLEGNVAYLTTMKSTMTMSMCLIFIVLYLCYRRLATKSDNV